MKFSIAIDRHPQPGVETPTRGRQDREQAHAPLVQTAVVVQPMEWRARCGAGSALQYYGGSEHLNRQRNLANMSI